MYNFIRLYFLPKKFFSNFTVWRKCLRNKTFRQQFWQKSSNFCMTFPFSRKRKNALFYPKIHAFNLVWRENQCFHFCEKQKLCDNKQIFTTISAKKWQKVLSKLVFTKSYRYHVSLTINFRFGKIFASIFVFAKIFASIFHDIFCYFRIFLHAFFAKTESNFRKNTKTNIFVSTLF
jgi:hypothetical protein